MAWMLFFIVGGSEIHVDLIEWNHIYDRRGNRVFSQVVLWDFDASDGRPHNVGWFIGHEAPRREGRMVRVNVWNGRKILRFRSTMYRETRSMEDPERADSRDWWRGENPNLMHEEKR